jgi:hypothetical protein
VSTTKKRQPSERFHRKADEASKYLRELTSNLDWGYTWDGPKHNNTICDIEAFLKREKKYLPKLSLKNFRWHYAGEATYYFSGNGNPRSLMTTAMVDIDVHKTGSTEEAHRFAEEIRTHLPGLYTEGSTHGRGIHQYPIVEKQHGSANSVNLALKVFDLWLKAIMYLGDYDLDVVEIKGTCPTLTRKLDGSIKVTTGQLAKLPREIDRRLEEFQATTKVTPNQLLLLGLHIATLAEEAGWDADTVNEIRGAAHEMIRRPGMPRLETLRNAIKPLKVRWEGRAEGIGPIAQLAAPTTITFARPVAPDDAAGLRSRDGVPSKKRRVQSGSNDAPMVSDELAARISTDFRRLVNNNWDDTLAGAGRRKVAKKDVAVEVAIYHHIADHRNPDNSVPVAWFKILWDDLKERGYTDWAFDPSRYAAIRSYMTAKGWITWEDKGYVRGREIDGTCVKGQATRHGASTYLIGYGEEDKDSGSEGGGERGY